MRITAAISSMIRRVTARGSPEARNSAVHRDRPGRTYPAERASRMDRVVFLRGVRGVRVSGLRVTVGGRHYALADLSDLSTTWLPRRGRERWAAIGGWAVLLLAGSVIMRADTWGAKVAALLVSAVAIAVSGVVVFLRPPRHVLQACHRGRLERVFESADVVLFNKVVRAVTRAQEYHAHVGRDVGREGGREPGRPVFHSRSVARPVDGPTQAIVAGVGTVALFLVVVLIAGLGQLAEVPADGRPGATTEARAAQPDPADRTPPAGPRTADPQAGISYRSYPEPWRPLDESKIDKRSTMETPDLLTRGGQYLVTENTEAGGENWAAIFAGSVRTLRGNDRAAVLASALDSVVGYVRRKYYPDPNTIEVLSRNRTAVGGHPARLTTFRLHFHVDGRRSTGELVGLLLVDVGPREAAVMLVSIPDTHPYLNAVVDEVLDSVRPL